jgi:hypothetical protein
VGTDRRPRWQREEGERGRGMERAAEQADGLGPELGLSARKGGERGRGPVGLPTAQGRVLGVGKRKREGGLHLCLCRKGGRGNF